MNIKKSFSAIIIFSLILQSLTFSFAFADNSTYHFKIRYYGEGTIQLRVIERTQ